MKHLLILLAILGCSAFVSAQAILPQVWVDPNEAFDGSVYTSPAYELNLGTQTWTSGPPSGCTFHVPYWTVGIPTQAGLQSAINDIEVCRTTKLPATACTILDIPPALYTAANNTVVIPQTSSTAALCFNVLRSTADSSLPNGQTVCAHGIQDNLASATDPGLDNPDCAGDAMTYQLGTTVTSISPGTFTLANGTFVNTSAYNDAQYMWTVEVSGTNKSALQTCSPLGASSSSQPPKCIGTTLAPDHWLIEDMEARMNVGNTGDSVIVSLLEAGTETSTSQLPQHIHFRKVWVHGDWTSLTTGLNSVSHDIWLGCMYCSVLDSQTSQSLRPGAEGHAIGVRLGSQSRIEHNWLEGQSSALFSGGFTAPPSIAGLVPGNDMEVRRNRMTFPNAWLGVMHIPSGHWSGQSLVRKNAQEFKEGQRVLYSGNIIENSDNSGGQAGVLGVRNVRNSAGVTYAGSNNYQTVISDYTDENNIWRNGCEGLEFSSSNSSLGNGGGVSFIVARASMTNDLIYNVTNTNPGCTGVNSVGIFLSSALQQWKGTIVGNGTTATFTATCSVDGGDCPAGPPSIGFGQMDINVGDPITISGCTVVTAFNVPTHTVGSSVVPVSVGPLATAGTTGLTAVWLSSVNGTDSSGNCILTKGEGGPLSFTMNHLTFITDSTHAFTSDNAPSTGPNFALNTVFENSILLGGGWFNNPVGEGTATEAFDHDPASMSAFDLAWPTRTASNYTEYGNNSVTDPSGCTGTGCHPPTSMFFPATPYCTGANSTSACVGFTGAMSMSSMPLTLSDYHQYALRSDSSFHNVASDGTDFGVNMSALDAAQTANLYVCKTSCGSGPYPALLPPPPSGVSIPATLFGMHWRITNPYPTMPFGSLRLWDSGTRWQLIQTGASTYSYTTLDSTLQLAKTHGLTDVLLTLSGTPNFISSDASNATCEYDPPAAGSCGVPTDIAVSCTNVNAQNNCDGKTDGTNQTWRNFIYNLATHINGLSTATYQHVTSFEMWNEFTTQQGAAFPAWEGTNDQLVRLYQDANCILTGRGTITSQSNATCTAGHMGVAAVNVMPGVTVTTPDSVLHSAPQTTNFGLYLASSGALNSVDVIAAHAYTGSPTPTQAEYLFTEFSTLTSLLASAGSSCAAIPCWSSEGSWGQSSINLSDLDMQAAYVTRYYLDGWSAGFQRLYWYAWDGGTVGPLWNQNGVNGCNDGGSGLGCLTKAGTAYGQAYGWMVGSVLSSPCAVLSGTVWSCTLSKGGVSYLIMWDTAQSCSGGVCTTANQTVAANWTVWMDMTTASAPVGIVGNQVPVGAKPVILQSNSPAPAAGLFAKGISRFTGTVLGR